MQGIIISNPKLEFLRPVLGRWFDCIDRYNAVRGDTESPYWLDEKANLGLLSAAAWMAEMITLQQSPTRKQTEEGERNGRADLFIATLATGQQPELDPGPAGHHQRREKNQLRQRPENRLPVRRAAQEPARRHP